MAQHFLLSAKARSLSLKQILSLSAKSAFSLFQQVRWADNGGKPYCVHCGLVKKHYFLASEIRWKCAGCRKKFSVTSGTIFANHKLPLKIYLLAIALFANGAKGVSALQLSRDLGVQYKTAFVLAHKIRHALFETREQEPLSGKVELDGSYYGGIIKPENRKEDRKDRRLKENQNGKRRCVFVMRQRGEKGQGAEKTKTFILLNEDRTYVKRLVRSHIAKDTVIHSDESKAYEGVSHVKVHHAEEYKNRETGAHINMAESFFSRLRRAEIGTHHQFASLYLSNYANEMAYREDMRRKANGTIFQDLLGRALRTICGGDWTGYWQGKKRKEERLDCPRPFKLLSS